jgi:hypothetical protein
VRVGLFDTAACVVARRIFTGIDATVAKTRTCFIGWSGRNNLNKYSLLEENNNENYSSDKIERAYLHHNSSAQGARGGGGLF